MREISTQLLLNIQFSHNLGCNQDNLTCNQEKYLTENKTTIKHVFNGKANFRH